MIPSLTLLSLLVIVLGFVFAGYHGKGRWRRSAHLAPRAPWKRITGAVIALAALGTVTFGTWKSVSVPAGHATDTVLRPARPAPVVKTDDESGYGEPRLEPCRMILRAYLVRRGEGAPVIARGKSVVIDWPDAASVPQNLDLDWRGIDYWVSITVDEIRDGRGNIRLNGDQRLRVRTSSGSERGSSTIGGGIAYLGKGTVLNEGSASQVKSHEPLSLWPEVSRELQIWLEAELATKDDPLEEIALPDVRLLPSADRLSGGMTGPVFGFPPQPPGIALLAHWGPASLLLLLAAASGAYAFRRSGPAFAGLLAVAILYAGGLERILIHRLATSAADGQRPVAERRLAIERLGEVFFHPTTATTSLSAIADDVSQPAELRQSARGVIHAFTGPGSARRR